MLGRVYRIDVLYICLECRIEIAWISCNFHEFCDSMLVVDRCKLFICSGSLIFVCLFFCFFIFKPKLFLLCDMLSNEVQVIWGLYQKA